MADIKKLAKVRTVIHCSASISNWHDKIFKRYKAEKYKWWKHLFRPVTFFGLYRPKDFILCLAHRGERTIHWQGSDILAAGWHYRWLQKIKAKHICENDVEQGVLRLMLQQEIEIRPTFLSNPHEFKISYIYNKSPEVYCHVNKRAERESGFEIIEKTAKKAPEITFHIYGRIDKRQSSPNIIFHGYVPESQFNEEIKNYQAAIRLHEFDGMAETIMKSVLMGQYPISRIRYPHIDTYNTEEELVQLLKDLKNKTKPNTRARDYYMKQFAVPTL